MRFAVFSPRSTAARVVVVVSVWSQLSLLLSCVIADTVAQRIHERSVAASVENSSPPTFAPASDSLTADKLPVAPYAVTDSPTGTDVPESEATVADAAPEYFSESNFASDEITEAPVGWWLQKIPRTRLSAKSPKSLRAPDTGAMTFKSPGNPLTLSRVIAEVLYGPTWPAIHTSSECSQDMQTYSVHTRNFTLWAAKMLDATSKGPEGLFDGNVFSFGNFDQCMGTKSKNLNISGGYSLVDIDYRPIYELHPGFYEDNHLDDYEPLDDDETAWKAINHNIQETYIQRHKFQWAVCLPDTCHYKDVEKIVSNVLVPKMNRHGLEVNVTIDPMLHTSSKSIYKYTLGFYVVSYMYLLFSGLIAVGTLYDLAFLYYRPKSEHGPMKKILKPFSLIANMQRLLKPSESKEFSIINGLKVFCIIQVIPGHRWLIEFGSPQSNPNYVHWLIHNIWMGHFKCTIFLETFFVISGFLTFQVITKHLTEKKHLNFIPIMIYRYLRIIPVYTTLIVTYIFVLPYLNDGPYWKKLIYRESERCQTNWWTNMLFINNYVHTDELCIIPAWYLACDMHFFIIGTLLTYAIWKWRQQGLIMLGAFLTLSTIIPTYIILNEEHRGVLAIAPQNLRDISKDRFFTEVYIKSHMRSLTYFVGILAGYLYMQMKDKDYKFSLKSRIVVIPTILILGNIIYLLCGVFYILGHQYNAYEHAFYFTVGRLVWSLLIAYALIAHGLSNLSVCISGFFGHRIFHVLGKLVFCIYMFQELIQLQTIGSIRTPTYQNITYMVWRWSGDTLMAIFYAFAINVMIESPFDRLQKNFVKIIFGNEFLKPKPQLPTNDTENKTEELTP